MISLINRNIKRKFFLKILVQILRFVLSNLAQLNKTKKKQLKLKKKLNFVKVLKIRRKTYV